MVERYHAARVDEVAGPGAVPLAFVLRWQALQRSQHMRILGGILILTMAFGVACANRSASSSPSAAAAAAPAPASPPAATAAAQTNVQPRLTESDYRGFMKTVGTTYPAMQMHLKGGMTAEAAKEAQTLAQTFGEVERFWTQNNKADAVKLAQQARAYATETAGAATAGDAQKAMMTATNMQGMCKQCHGLYREMDPDNPGGFRFKPGVIAAN
jgi:hypothetical protein